MFSDMVSDMSDFYLVAGLGNPGREYEGTRHNVGFAALDALMERAGCSPASMKTFGKGLLGNARIGDKRVLFLKPLTYMNRSGDSVREVTEYYHIDPDSRLIILCDDIYLPPGTLRIRRNGSDGGHNGLKSILANLDGRNCMRLRIGVGDKPHPDADLAAHVLGRFGGDDRELMEKTYSRAAEAVECLIENGIDTAMNRYNGSAS